MFQMERSEGSHPHTDAYLPVEFNKIYTTSGKLLHSHATISCCQQGYQ